MKKKNRKDMSMVDKVYGNNGKKPWSKEKYHSE